MHGHDGYDRRIKVWLLVVSLATIGALAAAALRENLFADWRQHRRAHAARLEDRADDPLGVAAAREFEVQVAQHYLPDLGAVDRCTTCHAGVEDPRMADEMQPHRTHPGRYLEVHDPSKFGCTVCHEGQGRATETADAHGVVPHWERPMLAPGFRKTACTKCHAEAELYAHDSLLGRLDDQPTSSTRLLRDGRRLVDEHGCLGCHVLGGKGGTTGPDLSRTGEKTRHQLDFSHLDRDVPRDVPVWLEQHFLAPAVVSPGSVMPPRSKAEAVPLTAYMLAQRAPVGAAAWSRRPEEDPDAPSGRVLFERYCSACHGMDGHGGTVRAIRTPSLNNPDFLAVAGDDYLRFIIANGRAFGDMPAWRAGHGNLTRDEIDRIVSFVRGWQRKGARLADVDSRLGDATRGRAYYRGACIGCHGQHGEGGIGSSLASATFLAVADDRFLARSIIDGRPGTAMPAWRNFSAQAVSDILAYIRSWQAVPPTFDAVAAAARDASVEVGAQLYGGLCASCHGREAQGALGPSLASPDFLGVVDDRALYRAIVEGRPSTAMPAWRHLTAADVGSLLRFLRSLAPAARIELDAAIPVGDPAVGAVHYRATCASCHGGRGLGGVGPQLANPVFLDSVSDAALFHWIAYGRAGTAMQGFLVGEQGPTELTRRQIADVIAHLRSQRLDDDWPILRAGVGNPTLGAELYAGHCASCHGIDGEGTSGPQLNNPSFLRAASDGFLAATIVLGRTGSPMRSMVHGRSGLGQIATSEIADLVAYIRQWEADGTWRTVRRVTETSQRSVASGADLYAGNCAGCHGPNGGGHRDGTGYYAPALNDPSFQHAVTDGQLLATIALGRSRTPMRPFGNTMAGIGALEAGEISDIVTYIRSWQADAATDFGG